LSLRAPLEPGAEHGRRAGQSDFGIVDVDFIEEEARVGFDLIPAFRPPMAESRRLMPVLGTESSHVRGTPRT
jgi:hypothetical protein